MDVCCPPCTVIRVKYGWHQEAGTGAWRGQRKGGGKLEQGGGVREGGPMGGQAQGGSLRSQIPTSADLAPIWAAWI